MTEPHETDPGIGISTGTGAGKSDPGRFFMLQRKLRGAIAAGAGEAMVADLKAEVRAYWLGDYETVARGVRSPDWAVLVIEDEVQAILRAAIEEPDIPGKSDVVSPAAAALRDLASKGRDDTLHLGVLSEREQMAIFAPQLLPEGDRESGVAPEPDSEPNP